MPTHAPLPFGLVEALVAFVVSLLVGAAAIHVASLYVYRDTDQYLRFKYALGTAVFGALAWVLTSWLPLVGGVLALVAWVAVVRWRYRGGWTRAATTGVLAWALAVVVVAALELLGVRAVSAFGVPGV